MRPYQLSLPSQSVSSVSSNPVSLNVHGELDASEETEPHQPYTSNHPLTDLDQLSTSGQQVINLDQPTTSSHQPINLGQPCTSGHPVIDLDQPSTSGYQQIDLDDPHDIEALQMMFPDRSIEYLRGIRGNNITLQETIDEILGKSEHIACEGKSASDVLNILKKSMKPYMDSVKLKVDKEDLVMDFFHYYKSLEFDPAVPIKVQIKGEPAVDNGGVLCQAFTDVFYEIAGGESYLRLFRGPNRRLTPIYSSEHVLTGVFEVLGKLIAHSLIQGRPGFLFLAPVIYWYIATGDLSEAVARASCLDIGDTELASFIERIKDGTVDDIKEIAQDDNFLRFMQECRQNRMLKEENKDEIMQCLIIHDTILKHKATVDQLRKGLSILGFLKELEKAPAKFEHFFVHSGDDISSDYIKSLFKLPVSTDVQVNNVVQMLYRFVEDATKEDLSNFLCFITGSRSSTSCLVPGSISISVVDADSIFASTCTLELKLPRSFSHYSHFKCAIRAMLPISGKKYTTV